MERLIDKFKRHNRVLLIFNHGLGDFILFLPVFFELQKQVGKKLTLGVPEKRQFHLIYPHVTVISDNDRNRNLTSKFDFVYRVSYPDVLDSSVSCSGFSKPYLCAYSEFGMKEFDWKKHKFNVEPVKDSKRIGLHFFGHTSANTKFCPLKTANQIWKEVLQAGFEPFEIHQRPAFVGDYEMLRVLPDDFSIANESNSIRFQSANLKTVFDEILKCRWFFGVDAGPLYLALSLLGNKQIVGLENKKLISNFLPEPIQTVSVNQYKNGTVLNLLETMEKNTL